MKYLLSLVLAVAFIGGLAAEAIAERLPTCLIVDGGCEWLFTYINGYDYTQYQCGDGGSGGGYTVPGTTAYNCAGCASNPNCF